MNRLSVTHWKLAFQMIFLVVSLVKLVWAEPVGVINGVVLDRETQTPLIGANVLLVNTVWGATSDENGNFVIERVPVGSWSLQFRFIGYETVTKTDVIVRPNRFSEVNAVMKEMLIEREAVTVTAGYFSQSGDEGGSSVVFGREEIRRAPGSAGDVSRIMMSLPSIAKVNDQSNSLIVRGGSPMENAFYVDNIEIPNINHFPTQGASGGPIGLLNVDLIEDVQFYSGGFSSIYGNRMSSIMDIQFRQGNEKEFDGQLDLNFSGFGAVLEGPLPGRWGTWIFSARRSYLDLLVKSFDLGTSIAPVYGDLQFKSTLKLSSAHQLTFLGIWADDHNQPDHKTALENQMQYFGAQDINQTTVGINWRGVWGPVGFSNTSLSMAGTSYKEDIARSSDQAPLMNNDSREMTYTLRHVSRLRIFPRLMLEAGGELKAFRSEYNNRYQDLKSPDGQSIPDLVLRNDFQNNLISSYMNLSLTLPVNWTITGGLRYDYQTQARKSLLSPRLNLSWQAGPRTTLNLSWGRFYQILPTLFQAQMPMVVRFDPPRATHAIFGFHYLLTENTRLSIETYYKTYRKLPLDSLQPANSILDEIVYGYGFFLTHEHLINSGQADARGIEWTIQKKLATHFYGLMSGSISQSRYRDLTGKWRNRSYDNRFIFSIEGGYKPNSRWEFSSRWLFAGGAPYTPMDLIKSAQQNDAVYDDTKINANRYPDYHSLNIRFDRRFHFKESNLVLYISVWNLYNRKNVATWYWNPMTKQQDAIYQWQMLPIFGLEYEF